MEYTHTVVTPCLNPGPLLAETVDTVLNQRAVTSGRVRLDYQIVDGGSTDGTVEYLQSLRTPGVRWTSESDDGMYDALVKGLVDAPGDVQSYLNAGDLYHPNAFDVVADTIHRTDGWVTGMSVMHNPRGDVISARTPFRFRRSWFRHGAYGTILPFLQQESTFWTGELAQRINLRELRSFRLAGDAYIWACLSMHADLTVVSAHLGGFRLHDGQLSRDREAYCDEMRRFTSEPNVSQKVIALADRVMAHAPMRVRRRLSRGSLLAWDRDAGWTRY